MKKEKGAKKELQRNGRKKVTVKRKRTKRVREKNEKKKHESMNE